MYCGPLETKFLISVSGSFNLIQIAGVSTKQVVLIYISVAIYWSLGVLCVYLFVCVMSNHKILHKIWGLGNLC